MTPLGWIFLLSSLAFVWGLTAWCFYRVLSYEEEGEAIQVPPASLGG